MQEDAAGLDVLGQFLRRRSSGEQVEAGALFDAQGFADGVIAIENGEFGRGPAKSARHPPQPAGRCDSGRGCGLAPFPNGLGFFACSPEGFGSPRATSAASPENGFGPALSGRGVNFVLSSRRPPVFFIFASAKPRRVTRAVFWQSGRSNAFSFLQLTYKAGKSIRPPSSCPVDTGLFRHRGGSAALMGECPERQRGGTVNPLAMPS